MLVLDAVQSVKRFTYVAAFMESRGRKFLRNMDTFTPDYTASHLTRRTFIVTAEITPNLNISDVYYIINVCGSPLPTHKVITVNYDIVHDHPL